MSVRVMLRLIRVDTLRRVHNVGFLKGRLNYQTVIDSFRELPGLFLLPNLKMGHITDCDHEYTSYQYIIRPSRLITTHLNSKS